MRRKRTKTHKVDGQTIKEEDQEINENFAIVIDH